MYSQKNGYARLNNYGGKLFNNVVGSVSPDQCDMQYELVRVQSSPFNPWYPIREEVWSSYYNQEDPWSAEREKELALKQLSSQMPPPKFVMPQQYTQQIDETNFKNRLLSQQLGQPNVQNLKNFVPTNQFVELNNSCSSCVDKNKDCKDDCEYSFCYAPACSTMKPCVRDNASLAGRKQICTVVTAPII